MRAWHATSKAHARLNAWQRGLLAMLGLDERAHPSAPLTACGMGFEAGEWLHADPVHFAAGLNEVSLVPLRGDAAPSDTEMDALTPMLAAHFIGSGFDVHRGAHGWLICAAQPYRTETVVAEYARTHEWGEVLPSGEGAGELRRWMTEAQMLLHDHAVNDARAARGLPAMNALWLWGSGRVDASPVGSDVACLGRNAYLRGLCLVHDWRAPTAVHSVQELLAVARDRARTVAVVEAHDLNEFESQYLSALVEALRTGVVERITLALDEWRIDIDRWRWRRFWRGALSPDAWTKA